MAVTDGDLRAIFRSRLNQVHWQSFEPSHVGAGVPDANGCFEGIEFWIETKTTAGWSVVFQPAQIGWISRRARAGGRIFIAIRRHCTAGPRRVAADELWLVPGRLIDNLIDIGLQPMVTWPGVQFWADGPAHWRWDEVLARLTK